jgi:hypothetical protein
MFGERRSRIDTRSEYEKQQIGERRSGIDRRTAPRAVDPSVPSAEQLALLGRRLTRAMRDERSRCHFGVARGEGDFTFYPDVIRLLEWIEASTKDIEKPEAAKVTLRRSVP